MKRLWLIVITCMVQASSCMVPRKQSLQENTQLDILNKGNKNTITVCISGGSASGKTTVAKQVVSKLAKDKRVSLLSQDMYFEPENQPRSQWIGTPAHPNYDLPSAINFVRLRQDVHNIKLQKRVIPPLFKFGKGPTEPDINNPIDKPEFLVMEGIFALLESNMDLCDFKYFVHASEELRLQRRIARDKIERGIDEASTRADFEKMVKPSHDQLIEPSQKNADLVLDGALDSNLLGDEVLKDLAKRLK